MATLEKIESSANATPDSGHVIAFFVEENNKLVLKAKKSDGTIVDVMASTGTGSNATSDASE
jgi:hypothetical protein